MQCRSVLTRIDALRTKELSTIEKIAVEGHLATCRSCNASTTDVDHLAGAVKSLAIAPPVSCLERIADAYDYVENVWVAFSNDRIRMITTEGSLEEFRLRYAKRFGRVLRESPIPEALRGQVLAALHGEGVDTPKVDLEETNELEHDVLQMLTKIPRGQVRTYAWVAKQIGRPRAVRAVANVIAKNIVPFVVPCHRVVPSTGGIGNYAFGSEMKRTLLASEGVDVEQLERLAREHVRYIGSKTTHVFCFPTCHGANQIREENRVPFRDAEDALEQGYRPCRYCQPVVAA